MNNYSITKKYVFMYLNILNKGAYKYRNMYGELYICGSKVGYANWAYRKMIMCFSISSLFGTTHTQSERLINEWIFNLPLGRLIKNATNQDVIVFDS